MSKLGEFLEDNKLKASLAGNRRMQARRKNLSNGHAGIERRKSHRRRLRRTSDYGNNSLIFDRRLNARCLVNLHLKSVKGFITNLSQNGLCLLLPPKFNFKSDLLLEVMLPKDKKALAVSVVPKWKKKTPVGSVIGGTFKTMSHEDGVSIARHWEAVLAKRKNVLPRRKEKNV